MKKWIFVLLLIAILATLFFVFLPERKEREAQRKLATLPIETAETTIEASTAQNPKEQAEESLRGSWGLRKKKVTTIISFGEERRVYIKSYRKNMPDTNAEGIYMVEGDKIKFFTYDGEVEYAFQAQGDCLLIGEERYSRIKGDVHDE